MRHKRLEGAGDQNVDSLLDTMANVVGILIVLMAVSVGLPVVMSWSRVSTSRPPGS